VLLHGLEHGGILFIDPGQRVFPHGLEHGGILFIGPGQHDLAGLA
jgi:hypothetical protein